MSRQAAKLPDWIFSARSKRRVIDYVVSAGNRGKVFGERELAEDLGVGRQGSIDEHLFALAQLGLLRRREGPRRFEVLTPEQMNGVARELSAALRTLTATLEQITDEPVERP
jgi:DNA-binding FadR family transcriptional regulator